MAQEHFGTTERSLIERELPYSLRWMGNTLWGATKGAVRAVVGGGLSMVAAPAAIAPATAINLPSAGKGLLTTAWSPFKATGHLLGGVARFPGKALDATVTSLKNPGGIIGRVRASISDLKIPFSKTADILTEGPVELFEAARRSFVTPFTRGICNEIETPYVSTGLGGAWGMVREGVKKILEAPQRSTAITAV